jgi:hypothetical protein
MNIRTLMFTVLAVLWAAVPIKAQVIEGGEESPARAQPQNTLRYIDPLVMEDAGGLADPCVIVHQGRYYLYLTGGLSGGWTAGSLTAPRSFVQM